MKKQTDNNIINKQTNKIKSTQLETRKNDFGKNDERKTNTIQNLVLDFERWNSGLRFTKL